MDPFRFITQTYRVHFSLHSAVSSFVYTEKTVEELYILNFFLLQLISSVGAEFLRTGVARLSSIFSRDKQIQTHCTETEVNQTMAMNRM